MILVDMRCEKCERVAVDELLSSVDEKPLCCGEPMSIVLSPPGSRYRFNDWPTDPRFYRGQVKCVAAECGHYEDSGEFVQQPTRPGIEDKMQDRRDRVYSNNDRRRGRSPIVVDLGSRRS